MTGGNTFQFFNLYNCGSVFSVLTGSITPFHFSKLSDPFCLLKKENPFVTGFGDSIRTRVTTSQVLCIQRHLYVSDDILCVTSGVENRDPKLRILTKLRQKDPTKIVVSLSIVTDTIFQSTLTESLTFPIGSNIVHMSFDYSQDRTVGLIVSFEREREREITYSNLFFSFTLHTHTHT